MRVMFALLALAATTISANDVIKVEGPVAGNNSYYLTTPQTTPAGASDINGFYEADENVALVFNLFGFGAAHPFGFSATLGGALANYNAVASPDCTQAVVGDAPIFAWYPNTTTLTGCTVTLPGQVNGTQLAYRCANHAEMTGAIRFATPSAAETSTAQASTGSIVPSPTTSSTGGAAPAGSSTGGATPVPTPTPTPKPGAAAAQVSGVVGLAVALIAALVL